MQVAKNKVVTIDYTLKDDQGNVLDTSAGSDPLAYIQGMRNIIVGLENALEGKSTGDKVNVVVPPEEGYGPVNEQLRGQVDRSAFEGADDVKVGMRFHAQTEHGTEIITVIAVDGDKVTIDANHPLAGQDLHFDVEIVDVRDATEDEISHGHVHGPGGHEH
jgi:FKBP-type peptidyl-prolyl cis-trans isomerase SlyD